MGRVTRILVSRGQRFGILTVKSEVLRKSRKERMVTCICDCGEEKDFFLLNLRSGYSKSCGCLKKVTNITHGFSKTHLYRKFSSLKSRCNNKLDSNYKYYGKRGIKCEWSSFEEFRSDMGMSYEKHVDRFGKRNTTIDRIDVNGNYSKQNCRWATSKEQIENRRYRPTLFFHVFGERMNVKKICEKYKINRDMFLKRIRLGWDIETAVIKPSSKR